MTRRLSAVTLAVIALAFVALAVAQAKKHLYGEMTLNFNSDWHIGIMGKTVPDWVGTINIDGTDYGMLFFAFGSGKPFETDPPGKPHFFEEVWAIYTEEPPEQGDASVYEDWLPENDPKPDGLVMWGYDRGITNGANLKYHMTGNVEEAFGDFAEWQGRNVYMRGVIEWVVFPVPGPGGVGSAPGTFRLN